MGVPVLVDVGVFEDCFGIAVPEDATVVDGDDGFCPERTAGGVVDGGRREAIDADEMGGEGSTPPRKLPCRLRNFGLMTILLPDGKVCGVMSRSVMKHACRGWPV